MFRLCNVSICKFLSFFPVSGKVKVWPWLKTKTMWIILNHPSTGTDSMEQQITGRFPCWICWAFSSAKIFVPDLVWLILHIICLPLEMFMFFKGFLPLDKRIQNSSQSLEEKIKKIYVIAEWMIYRFIRFIEIATINTFWSVRILARLNLYSD